MRLSTLTVLALVAAAPANAFVGPNLQKAGASTTALEVIRSKNFKRAKLVEPEIDAGGLAKAGVSYRCGRLTFLWYRTIFLFFWISLVSTFCSSFHTYFAIHWQIRILSNTSVLCRGSLELVSSHWV